MLPFYCCVSDSNTCFKNTIEFQTILNNQYNKNTIDKEDENRVLPFLDIKVINNGTAKYEFHIYRKDAITKVQVKPESCHIAM